MALYTIRIGSSMASPDFEFTRSDFRSLPQLTTAVDILGSELAVDELRFDVDYDSGAYVWFSPKDYDGVMTKDGYMFAAADTTPDLSTVPYGTPVWLLENGTLYAKLYFKNAVRSGARTYTVTAMSAVGFLAAQDHMGGLYTNVTVGALLTEIIGAGFVWTADPEVASEKVSGWLPAGSRRDNLHLLMFAMGISLTKNADGSIRFLYIYDGDGTLIPQDRCFPGVSLDYNSEVSAVEVAEHSFFALSSTEAQQLFDNTNEAAVSGVRIIFDGPYFGLDAQHGLTIDESGVNYAIVSGTGTLTGKPYTHNTRLLRKTLPGASGKAKLQSSTEDALVNALNSANVAGKLLAYYSTRKTARVTVKALREQAGDVVRFEDPKGDTIKGVVTQANFAFSTWPKAALKVIAGYVPGWHGNFYHNRMLIDEPGEYSLPSGVTDARYVLIAPGSGGVGGYDGEQFNAQSDLQSFYDGYRIGYFYKDAKQYPAAGGAAGDPGLSGKILTFDATIADGEVLTVSFGAVGTGGAKNGGAGTAGGETVLTSASLGTKTTADGSRVDGYVDPVTGELFAAAGLPGVPGGDGGLTDTIDLYGYKGGDGLPGGNAGEQSAGTPGAGKSGSLYVPRWTYRASGGASGGAAYGADGDPGGDADAWYTEISGGVNLYVHGGDGGDGADALAPPTPAYGCGGGGGNGGGGAGDPGGCELNAEGYGNVYAGQKGSAGSGSVGGDGGAGCLIIFY